MNKEEILRELIGQAIGEASMCWDPLPAGVFDSTKAVEVIERVMADIRKLETI